MSRFNKPLPGTKINFLHPLCPVSPSPGSEGGLLLPFDEGSGRPRAYLGPKVNSTSEITERLAVLTGSPSWNPYPGAIAGRSQWGGAVFSHLNTTDDINLGVNTDFLPLDAATIIVSIRKRDTTNRASTLFGVDNGTAAFICMARVPSSNDDVEFYWAGTAGSNLVSAVDPIIGDDVWAFSAGPRGLEIWKNGGLLASSGTAASARSGNTADFKLGNVPFWAAGDIVDYAFFYVYPRELRPEEIRQVSIDPFCFYDWGEDEFEGGPVTVPLESGGAFIPSGGLTNTISPLFNATLTTQGAIDCGYPETPILLCATLHANNGMGS